MLAMDAATGKTARKTVAGKGVDNQPTKRGGYGITPAAEGGKVFWVGSSGKLYAFDAATGKVLWGVVAGSVAGPPDMLASVVVAEGVVVAPVSFGNDNSVGIAGFDPGTGMKQWTVNEAMGARTAPAIWRSGGRAYLLMGNTKGEMRLIDPRDGKVLWTVGGLGQLNFPLAPSDTRVVVDGNPATVAGDASRSWVAYRLAVQGRRRTGRSARSTRPRAARTPADTGASSRTRGTSGWFTRPRRAVTPSS
jgi:outer membrane protein assembly factor BamB